MERLYFEDLYVGFGAESTEITVTADEIKEFAGKFDPQAFHIDEAAALESPFRGLIASGWHTAALTMKLMTTGGVPTLVNTVGTGIDELQWRVPVRPDDRLHIRWEVIGLRPSRSKVGSALIRRKVLTINQGGAIVQSMVCNEMVARRPEL